MKSHKVCVCGVGWGLSGEEEIIVSLVSPGVGWGDSPLRHLSPIPSSRTFPGSDLAPSMFSSAVPRPPSDLALPPDNHS